MRAPTGGNCMPYSIIDVTDQSIKDKLAETCDHQPFIAQAKMVLIFCADYHRWYRKFKMAGCENIPAPELSNMVLATEDAVIAAHTACIAAKAWHRFLLYRRYCGARFTKAFKPAPAGITALHAGLRLCSTQQKKENQTTRFGKSSIVFENRYRELSEEELLEMMPNDRMKAFYNRKYVSDFARKWCVPQKEIYKNWNSKE